MFRFTIRDVLWLMVVAMTVEWIMCGSPYRLAAVKVADM